MVGYDVQLREKLVALLGISTEDADEVVILIADIAESLAYREAQNGLRRHLENYHDRDWRGD